MNYASNILYTSFLSGALPITFQLKMWMVFSFKCLGIFDLSCDVFCSLYLVSIFLIASPKYDSLQLHIPSKILHHECKDLSFNWKRVPIFLVRQLILTSNVLFINWWNFFINWLDNVSFLEQKGISNKITNLRTSNRLSGILYSSVPTLLYFGLNVLITLSINIIG